MSASRQFTRRALLRYGAGATVLGAVGAGTACAPIQPAPTNGAAGTFTVYWNAGHAYDAYQQVFDQFGQDHDLEVNWQKFQWPDLTTKLVADFQSGNVPDLVEENTAGVGIQYGLPGDVLALDEFAAGDAEMGFPDDFVEASVTSRQYQGKTYSIPLQLTANGLLFYNKQMLSAAGFPAPPTTWEEFLEVARATNTGDVSGTALNSDYSYSAPFYYQQQVAYSNVATRDFMVPEDRAELTLQWMQDLVYAHQVSPAPVASTDYSGPQKLFSAGRAATFFSGPWDLGPVRTGSPDLDLGLAPPLAGRVQASSLAGAGLMVPAKAKDPQLSWELVRRLTALETELAVTAEVGMSMPRKSWAQDASVAGDPDLAVIATALSLVTPDDPELAASGRRAQINELYKKSYQEIVIQQRPVAEALAEFRDASRGALG